MSGSMEYFFSGYGLNGSDTTTVDVTSDAELSAQLERGDLFSIGRHNVASSILIEMTPLFSLSPTVLANLSDGSALLQVIGRYSLSDNATVLGSLSVPVGPAGTEFGGLRVPLTDRELSSGPGLFIQLAGYF